MRAVLRIILMQELFYGAFLVVLGVIIGLQHGWESGVKTFLYAFMFFQPIIFWINRKILKSVACSRIRSKNKY